MALSLGGCTVTPLQVHFWFRRFWIYKLRRQRIQKQSSTSMCTEHASACSQAREASVICITFKGEMSVKEEIRARKPFFTCSRHVKQLHETTGNSTGQKYLNLFFLHSSRQRCLLKDVRTSAVPVRTSRIPWSQPSKVLFRDKGEDGAFPSRWGCLRPPLGTPPSLWPHLGMWLYTLSTALSEGATKSLSDPLSHSADYLHVGMKGAWDRNSSVRKHLTQGSSRSRRAGGAEQPCLRGWDASWLHGGNPGNKEGRQAIRVRWYNLQRPAPSDPLPGARLTSWRIPGL